MHLSWGKGRGGLGKHGGGGPHLHFVSSCVFSSFISLETKDLMCPLALRLRTSTHPYLGAHHWTFFLIL